MSKQRGKVQRIDEDHFYLPSVNDAARHRHDVLEWERSITNFFENILGPE